MDSKDRQFLLDHSNWTESDLETLNEICIKLSGEELGVKDNLKMLWYEFTTYSKKGEKQKDWQNVGSDQVIEHWAMETSEDLHHFLSNFSFSGSEEEMNEMMELVEQADEILGKMIY